MFIFEVIFIHVVLVVLFTTVALNGLIYFKCWYPDDIHLPNQYILDHPYKFPIQSKERISKELCNHCESVHIDWIRHGFSCTNAIHLKSSNWFNIWKYQSPNPSLTNLGIRQCFQAWRAVHKTGRECLTDRMANTDLVCCSNLLRAIETAWHMYPGRQIWILPYVHERTFHINLVKFNIDRANAPQSQYTTFIRLVRLGYDPVEIKKRIKFSLYNTILGNDDVKHIPKPYQPDLRKFLSLVLLTHWLNPTSDFNIASMTDLPIDDSIYTRPKIPRVAIVSHSIFLKSIVRQTKMNKKDNFYLSREMYQSPTKIVSKNTEDDDITNTSIFCMMLDKKCAMEYVDNAYSQLRVGLKWIYRSNSVLGDDVDIIPSDICRCPQSEDILPMKNVTIKSWERYQMKSSYGVLLGSEL